MSWKVVTYIYATGSAICILFGALHYADVEQVKGFWLIFCLFPPCLLYSIVKQRAQRHGELTAAAADTSAGAQETQETKKKK